ncbi:Peptidase S1 domain-containing protein [Meloidogyne graminicola]|uniref:Peptidase S1 domain-containing protein n=1 Tax=Meloidogyne graminicola TaxID=189291 RepID=A0A8S9ZXZ7_9BILA|nr:Peptidase S1 domain-containing protein [Meloidogyne graminicola]
MYLNKIIKLKLLIKYILIIIYFFQIKGVKNYFVTENYASEHWTLNEYFEKGDNINPIYYDSHRCGLPIHINGDKKEGQRFKRYRPPNLRPHYHYHRHRHHHRHRSHHRIKHFNETHFEHNDHIHRKVMGGHGAEDGELPWVVAIHRYIDGYDEYHCTGTLISRRHVLTAAHCFFKYGNLLSKGESSCRSTRCCISYEQSAIPEKDVQNYISVFIGSVCLVNNGNIFGECLSKINQKRFIVSTAKYSQYFDTKCQFYDYAIIELENDVPAELANHICLLHLHKNTKLINWRQKLIDGEEEQLLAYGWGPDPITQCHKEDQNIEDCKLFAHAQLHLLTLAGIWTDNECINKVRKFNNHQLSKLNDIICTMEKPDFGFCQGDSGGGLIGQFEDINGGKRWFILGIISFGTDCFKINKGLVLPNTQCYTNVPYHKEEINKWLNGHLNLLSKQNENIENNDQYEFILFNNTFKESAIIAITIGSIIFVHFFLIELKEHNFVLYLLDLENKFVL